MAIPIPSPLVEFILLGPLDDRRQLQDSPILGDVWVEFGMKPDDRIDLLIEPYKGKHAGFVAGEMVERLWGETEEIRAQKVERANIAYLQGLIVAKLTFTEVVRIVVPRTYWWISKWKKPEEVKPEEAKPKRRKKPKEGEPPPAPSAPPPAAKHVLEKYTADKVEAVVGATLEMARLWHRGAEPELPTKEEDGKGPEGGGAKRTELDSLDRFVALTGLILWAGTEADNGPPLAARDQISKVLDKADVQKITGLIAGPLQAMLAASREELKESLTRDKWEGLKSNLLVWQVSRNRSAMPAISKSVPAVKADAAKTLFKVNCSEIVWAVVDSGIDGDHPALQSLDGTTSRVKRSFDFKNFRKIVSLSNMNPTIRKRNAQALLQDRDVLKNPPLGKEPEGLKEAKSPEEAQALQEAEALKEAEAFLELLAKDARRGGPVHWDLVERFVEIKPSTTPPSNHGTHVAGIIGASTDAAKAVAEKAGGQGVDTYNLADGMCPDIGLYDFRVLAPEMKDTEFAIIAALQFIRYLNDRDNFITVHGVNLSLSIPHDVRNFACGRTPICDESERLVESGIVVVAAAGNHGYKSFETREGFYDSYAAFSITDPGNADSIITVGATHRYWPHTYGVSFFSSRGPTGDGRLKPDIVAPGERIRAPLPNGEWGDLDGTSMAAPHVSGAAAMLMARYSELIGQPRRIKRILCESATDLGRERSFQGHGMLDVLRAFQSI